MNAVAPKITPNQRAASAVRVKAPMLAERITAEHYRRRPELERRYGASGRRRCLEDAVFHLHFLAGSVEFGDPSVFADYISWVANLLAGWRIPPSDVAENITVMGEVLRDAVPAETFLLIRSHLQTALSRFDGLAEQSAGQTDVLSRVENSANRAQVRENSCGDLKTSPGDE